MRKNRLVALCAGCLLLMACLGVWSVTTVNSLRTQVSTLNVQLSDSETQRTDDTCALQKQLDALTNSGVQAQSKAQKSFAAALRNGEIHKVLILGDSISDGNGDSYFQTIKRYGKRTVAVRLWNCPMKEASMKLPHRGRAGSVIFGNIYWKTPRSPR